MGFSEVCGNGSVVWRVGVGTSRGSRGKDNISFKDIGRPDHLKKLRVRMRFKNEQSAREAAEAAAANVQKNKRHWFVVMDVPAVRRKSPTLDLPLEVRVEW